jgi:hypothetical protein
MIGLPKMIGLGRTNLWLEAQFHEAGEQLAASYARSARLGDRSEMEITPSAKTSNSAGASGSDGIES